MSQAIVTEWAPAWKLTDEKHQTRGETQWGKGVTNPDGVKDGRGGLCSRGYYHGYTSPYLAVIMNPQHASIVDPVLWEAEYRGTVVDDRGLKFGATEFRTVRTVAIPVITTLQCQAFAIWCAALVLDESDSRNDAWFAWATKWLTGEDRDAANAANAADAAYHAAAAAYYAAANATYAAAAAYAAYAANAADAAYYAANAAYYAANAAYYAAANATYAADLLEMAIAMALLVDEVAS